MRGCPSDPAAPGCARIKGFFDSLLCSLKTIKQRHNTQNAYCASAEKPERFPECSGCTFGAAQCRSTEYRRGPVLLPESFRIPLRLCAAQSLPSQSSDVRGIPRGLRIAQKVRGCQEGIGKFLQIGGKERTEFCCFCPPAAERFDG